MAFKRKTREDRIRDVMKKEPQLTYLEAMQLVLKGKNKKRKKDQSKTKKKGNYKIFSSGFETNRRKH